LQSYLEVMIERRDVFQAIADPTRRAIINMLADKPLNVNSIAGHFDMSRQAISLHIKILLECDLLQVSKQGRERYCEARLGQLNEVSVWVAQYRRHWENKLDSLETYIEKLKQQRHGKQKK
jgi:DNA-binding transcriptional ArsR family regulator